MKRWQRRLAFGCSCNERLLQLKIGLLSNHQNAAANNPYSGAGRITVDAREKENARAMMHYDYRRLQAAASTRASGTRPTLRSINQNSRVCSNFITPELTGRDEPPNPSKFSMRATLFALRLNELLGCALQIYSLSTFTFRSWS